MLINNAALTSDFLTQIVSISITFERVKCFNGRTAITGLVSVQSWTVTIKNNSDCKQSVFFQKCTLFM